MHIKRCGKSRKTENEKSENERAEMGTRRMGQPEDARIEKSNIKERRDEFKTLYGWRELSILLKGEKTARTDDPQRNSDEYQRNERAAERRSRFCVIDTVDGVSNGTRVFRRFGAIRQTESRK